VSAPRRYEVSLRSCAGQSEEDAGTIIDEAGKRPASAREVLEALANGAQLVETSDDEWLFFRQVIDGAIES
jgi:hypothetical protein